MRIKFLNTAFVGLMFTLISIVNLANAGLIEKDFNVLNDNLAVYDTTTKLTWLDLSVTDGLSFSAAGAAYANYRYATEAEVVDLFSSFFSGIDFSTTFNAIYTNNVKTIEFRQLFGETLSKHTFGMFRNSAGIMDSMGTYGDKVSHFAYSYSKDLEGKSTDQLHWHGVFLIAVPEPATLAIFSIGLIGLILRRLKNSACSVIKKT